MTMKWPFFLLPCRKKALVQIFNGQRKQCYSSYKIRSRESHALPFYRITWSVTSNDSYTVWSFELG